MRYPLSYRDLEEMFLERGFEAMLWLKKGFGFTGQRSVREQNDLLAVLFGAVKWLPIKRGWYELSA